jgi:hypothetical protein
MPRRLRRKRGGHGERNHHPGEHHARHRPALRLCCR